MTDTMAFGIGCFHFGVKKPPSFRLKGQDYVRELQRALEGIPNVDNIRIDADDKFKELEIEVKKPLSTLDEGTDFFPPSSLQLDIDFDIYIPARIQSELWPGRLSPNLNAERFRISIRNTYYFPVSFVETVEPTEDTAPSDAAVAVREFLDKHFTDSKSEFIRFECLGPSPFHADFFLSSIDNKVNEADYDPEGFVVKYSPRKGYAAFEFVFDPAHYDDLQEAKGPCTTNWKTRQDCSTE